MSTHHHADERIPVLDTADVPHLQKHAQSGGCGDLVRSCQDLSVTEADQVLGNPLATTDTLPDQPYWLVFLFCVPPGSTTWRRSRSQIVPWDRCKNTHHNHRYPPLWKLQLECVEAGSERRLGICRAFDDSPHLSGQIAQYHFHSRNCIFDDDEDAVSRMGLGNGLTLLAAG